MAAALMLAPPGMHEATAGQSAATVYALNCLGCHFPPRESDGEGPVMTGQFDQTATGRVFYIRTPPGDGKPLAKEQEAQLLQEILTWKKSCSVIMQAAPLLNYTGPR